MLQLEGTTLAPRECSSYHFPNEIWQECWSHCQYQRQELKALSKVCSLFYCIVQPLLCRRLSLTAPDRTDITRRNCAKWALRFTSLSTDMDLFATDEESYLMRSMIREFHLRGQSELLDVGTEYEVYAYNSISKAYKSMLEMIFIVLITYPNLNTLVLEDIAIDENVRTALAGLLSLQSLDLSRCSLLEPMGSLLYLEAFSICGHFKICEETQLVSNRDLRRLIINAKNQTRVILSSFTSLGSFGCLTTLIILIAKDTNEVFFSFLNMCPQLQSLRTSVISSHSLALSAIPLLSLFQGPIHIAALFVVRPVHTANLWRAGPSSKHSILVSSAEAITSLLS